MATTLDLTPPTSPDDLTGQVGLVTGGGRGIGRAIAEALAAAGASVAVTARTADQVIETAALIRQAGGRALALTADVTDRQDVERAVTTIEHRLGPVDILVNNAGITGPIGPLWEVDPDEWLRTMDINVHGIFICSRAVLPSMVARRRGRIINVASHAGVHRWPQVSAYAISKSAVIKLTENLAVETKRLGVAVFVIHPGTVTVGLTEAVLNANVASESAAGRVAAWFRQQFAEGRGVSPDRAGQLAVTLASGRADNLSGRYVTVYDDVEEWIDRAAEIRRDDLYTLRLREGPEPRASTHFEVERLQRAERRVPLQDRLELGTMTWSS
jgi:NAD(P)-dependent dehydrogenase (short-subunit alcohol dehydrogenase family)